MPDSSAPLSHSVETQQPRVPVWDVPTRLFHWLLVGLMACAYLTFQFGDINMTYHKWTGYTLLTLVTYRLLWGVFGSNTARFSSFVHGPRTVFAYLKSMRDGHPHKVLGHNPLGGLMVVALLVLILLQGIAGLFTTDEILVEGPLVHLVPSAWADTIGSLHRMGYYVILGFVAVHVSAVLLYLIVKKENLILPMITGKKPRTAVPEGQALTAPSLIRAVVLFAVSAGLVWLGINVWTLA